MYAVFNCSVSDVIFTSPSRTLLQYIARIRKGIRKNFAAPLFVLPHFRKTLTSRSSASLLVVLLSDLFLQVPIS